MKLLILGGTIFLGRAAAEAALARGHEVTLFNRGRTAPDVLPGVERLQGDRDGGLDALRRRGWDAVLDPSGYVPRVVRDSTELLADAAEHLTFVSSVSVYRSFDRPGFGEDSPVIELEDPATEDVAANYGGLKAACERVVDDVFAGRSANVRAGLLVGPHDPSGRFTYWPQRIARGGEVLAPGRPERPVQFVDARDLGDWLVTLAERRIAGTFNASAPPRPFADVVNSCLRATDTSAQITWVDDTFLLERGVGQWMELPLWIAEVPSEWRSMQEADVSRAIDAGLRFRPLDDTVRDTLAWAATTDTPTRPTDDERAVGLSPERESELLAAWHAGSPA